MKHLRILSLMFVFALLAGAAHAQMPGGSVNGPLYMNGNPIYGAALSGQVLTSPTINGGTISSPTITNGTLNSPTINEQTIGTGIVNASSGYHALRIASPTVMCTTSNSVGASCAEPTQTWSPGFADTNYTISCTCASIGTNVPIVGQLVKASNTLVVNVNALTAASAQCAEVDCLAIHD